MTRINYLPNVKIAEEAKVMAGIVVSNSVAPNTVSQGNPAIHIAK